MQKDQLNLLEDGLQLWLVALRNAPEANPQLLDLFPNLAVAMESSTGTLSYSTILSNLLGTMFRSEAKVQASRARTLS